LLSPAVYLQSHIDNLAEAVSGDYAECDKLTAIPFTCEVPVFRHFTDRFEPVVAGNASVLV
jgi:tryptophanase